MKNVLTILIGLLLAISNQTFAQTTDIKKRTQEAQKVYEGKIISQRSFWNTSRTKIFTAHQVQVSKAFKGNIEPIEEFVTHGGTIDGLTHYYFHGKSFAIEDEGIFFCKTYANSSTPADDFVMIKGQDGFIQYNKSSFDFQAFDHSKTYQNLQREVINPIELASHSTTQTYSQNHFEVIAEEWLNSNLNVFTNTDTVIQFSFDNIHVIGVDEVEFDILAKSNYNDIKFAASNVYLQYSTNAFGDNVVQNDKIEATKETIIEDQVYTLELADEATDIVKFLVNSGLQPNQLYPISQNYEKFLHVRISIQNIYQLASISFQNNMMTNESLFYDEATGEYIGFDKIAVSEPINPFLMPDITGFTPLHISAGTESILTIFGTQFGTTKGNVVFQNGDEPPGGNWTTDVKPIEIVSWDSTEIQVKVPSVDEGFYAGRPASTGTFKVVLPNGLEAPSDEWLLIDYAVFNYRITPTSESNPIFLNISDQVGGDGIANGTLNFWLDNDLHNTADARMVTNQALCDWNTKTKIKWGLNSLPSSDTTFADNNGVNLLYLAGEDEFSGVFENAYAKIIIVLVEARAETCNPMAFPFLREVDIAFRENPINANTTATGGWNFGLDTALNNELDFYSTMLHELGHAHLLMHAKWQGQIMSPTQGVGDNDRIINGFDEAGGEFVLAKSQENFENTFCPNTIDTIRRETFCSTTSTDDFTRIKGLSVLSTLIEDGLILSNQNDQSLDLEFQLFDVLGRRFSNREFTISSFERVSIPVPTSISSGVYFANFREKNTNQVITFKIIKP